MLILVRSIVFNVLFYLNTVLWLIIALPTFFMPYRAIIGGGEIVGPHQSGAAARRRRHRLRDQGPRENSARPAHRRRQAPVGVGDLRAAAAVRQSGVHRQARIAVDPDLRLADDQGPHGAGRSPRRRAGAHRHDRARARRTRRGRQLIIFPEGTRRPAGAEPRYKFGVAHLYAAEGVPCVPIALNSGLFWPRRSIRLLPGTVLVEILDPIAPGLDKNVFFERLQHDIETATARLIAEAKARWSAEALGESCLRANAFSRARFSSIRSRSWMPLSRSASRCKASSR